MDSLKFFCISMLVDSMINTLKSRSFFSRSFLASIVLQCYDYIAEKIDEAWMYIFLEKCLKQSDDDFEKILSGFDSYRNFLLNIMRSSIHR